MNQIGIAEARKPLPDTQSSQDSRGVVINKVGVSKIRYPITLRPPVENGGSLATPQVQHSVATINMYVSLPASKKGTHMSRFLEMLNEHDGEFSRESLAAFTSSICERLNAETAYVEISFPYFVTKKSPVTGIASRLDIDVSMNLVSGSENDCVTTLKIPATSLCPCSKEISAYGAHNQRCEMTVSVRAAEGQELSIDELFRMAEQCASTQVFPILKRPDEKWVTEKAYENPKFVEDIVRDLAVVLREDNRVVWYRCESENFESIHSHNAFAMVEQDKRS